MTLTVIIFLLVTLKQSKFSWIISDLKLFEESYNNLTRKEENNKNKITVKQIIKVISLVTKKETN